MILSWKASTCHDATVKARTERRNWTELNWTVIV